MEIINGVILTFNYEKGDVTVTERKCPVGKQTSTVTFSNPAAMNPYDEIYMYCIISLEFIKDGILTCNYDKRYVTVTEIEHPVYKTTTTVTV